MSDMAWGTTEKKVARRVFDAALQRELARHGRLQIPASSPGQHARQPVGDSGASGAGAT